MGYDFSKFTNELSLLNLSISEQMEDQFSLYYDLMIQWNQNINLTAITEFDEVVEKHFLDSVALGYYINLNKKQKVIDVGSGAGFPGIPLKILFPELEVVLLDSLNKRVKFLYHVIDQLNLKNISAVHGRAEEYARKEAYREQFDLCVSRAVAHLSSLSEYCLPYVKPGGSFVSYKSGDIDTEIEEAQRAIQLLGGRLDKVNKFQLPNTDYQRSFVIVNKVTQISKNIQEKQVCRQGSH